MLYKVFKYLLRLYLPLFFKGLKVRGLQNIPYNKPFILAVNHKNAFMDAYLVGFLLKKPIYFLTRSDVFKGKFVLRLFKALNLIPIYRKQDGHINPSKANEETFRFCYEALEQGKPILIFPEGQSEPTHELFELKKGLARIAFGAETKNNFNLELKIIPTVINYSHHFAPRHNVEVFYEEPISVNKYKESYLNQPSRTINQLTYDVFHSMKNKVEIIPIKEKNKFVKPFIQFLSLSYLPTLLISVLVLKKLNDDSFFMSALSTIWLIFGILEIVAASISAYVLFDLNFALITLLTKIIIGYVLLINGDKLVSKDYNN